MPLFSASDRRRISVVPSASWKTICGLTPSGKKRSFSVAKTNTSSNEVMSKDRIRAFKSISPANTHSFNPFETPGAKTLHGSEPLGSHAKLSGSKSA